MVEAIIGNLFDSGARTLVNTVNCVGVMGKGVALEFKKRFPSMFDDYTYRVKQGLVRLGEPYLFVTNTGQKIVNFPTKGHWRAASRLKDIAIGLDFLAANAEKWDLQTVAMPPLGCGNGGLDWADVGPLVYEKLNHLPISIVVYAPYGTPTSQLTNEFLRTMPKGPARQRVQVPKGLGEGSIVLLETLRQIYMQPFAQPIGRTKFQKLAYALTVCGVPTGYKFSRSSYGPFSTELRDEIHTLSNSNWLEEEPWGPMIVMRPTFAFEDSKDRFSTTFEQYAEAISKTTDLFSRIKDTAQAEVIATVLYAYQELTGQHDNLVSYDQVFTYVTEWKPQWVGSTEKELSILNSALTLAMSDWASRLDFTSVPESAIDTALGF